MRRLRISLFLAIAALCASAPSEAAIQTAVQASRTAGVAPLAVHFDATATTATGVDAFHDLLYTWSFGDASAGTWTPSGLSRNSALGPVAAHVFEQPGTYTVTLRVSDTSGQVATTTQTISVSDPDTVFSGADTVCISASGSFTGCPSGAQQVRASAFEQGMAYALAGKRVLFRRGESFPSNARFDLDGGGPGIVGAFGTGAAPRVTGSPLKLASSTAPLDDWRVMDLSFDGGSNATSVGFETLGQVARLLLLRVEVANFHVGLMMGTSKRADQVFVVDSYFHHAVGGGGGYPVFFAAERSALLGSRFEDALNGEHVVRIPYARLLVMQHNYLASAPATKHVLKMHAPVGTPSREIVISDNTFVGGANGWDVCLGPQNDVENERVEQVLVERNLFRSGSQGTVNLHVWGPQMTIRNNVFDLSPTSGGVAILVEQRGVGPIPDFVRLDNNTCFTNSGTVTCADVRIGSNHRVRNNLVVGPAGSSVKPGSAMSAGNLSVSTSPWAKTSPVTITDFGLDVAKSSALIDKGVALTAKSVDPSGIVQPADGDGDGVLAWDIGAFEVGTSSGGSGGGGPPPSPPAAPVLLP